MKLPPVPVEIVVAVAVVAVGLWVLGFWVFADQHPLLLVHPGRG
jgi:hypothetical protein